MGVHGLPAYQRTEALGSALTIAEPLGAPYRQPQILCPCIDSQGAGWDGHVAQALKVRPLLFPISLCLCCPWRNKVKTISIEELFFPFSPNLHFSIVESYMIDMSYQVP